MIYSNSDVVSIVSKMKKYYKNIYKLTPAELADFMKIRSNFIGIGIPLSEDKLTRPEEEVVQYILDKLHLTKNSDFKVNEDELKCEATLKDTLTTSVDLINDDRTEIRKHLFNESIVVDLERSGKAFGCTWNGKMTVCKVVVPSTWQIKIPQSLILDIFEKDKKVFDDIDARASYTHPELSKLGSYIYDLLLRHSDYSIIKRIIELEFENPKNIFIKSIDKRKINRLQNKGLSAAVAALLIAFAEQVEMKTFSPHTLISVLGYRTRLLKEFNDLI
jgi:hypothetical protein